MPPNSLSTNLQDDDGNQFISNLQHMVEEQAPSASNIIARSIITASFSGNERFDWQPGTGLRVSIPDQHAFVPFERASSAELRDRLFPHPAVRGNGHKSAAKSKVWPERSLAWWFGQMIHYGLPISIDKEAAQGSIKAAINADRLVVPPRLRDLEKKLRRDHLVTPALAPAMSNNTQPLQSSVSASTENNSRRPAKTQKVLLSNKQKKQPTLQVNVPPLRNLPSQPAPSTSWATARDDTFTLGSDSSSTSSSESEQDLSPKPSHLFTPNGHRITRPAEYPGLRERGEADKNDNQRPDKHQGSAKQSKNSRSVNEIGTVQNAVGEDAMDTDANEVTDDMHAQDVRSTQMDRDESAVQQDGVWDLDSSDESQAGSLIFHTPMQFVTKHRKSHAGRDQDQESVIFTGSSKKKALELKPIEHCNSKMKKRQGRRNMKEDISRSHSHDPNVQEVQIRSQDKTPSIKKGISSQRVRSEYCPSHWHTPVIEISSGSDDSSEEDSQMEIHARRKQRKSQFAHYNNPSQVRQVSKSNLRTESTRSKSLRLPATGLTSKHGAAKPEASSSYTNSRGAERQTGRTASSRIERLRDLTGSGTTEGSGALYSGDEDAVTFIDARRRQPQNIDSVRTRSPELRPRYRKSSARRPAKASTAFHSESDSDLPSIAELFSSQDTPENWKSKDRRALEKARKQTDIDKSFDPDSVPELREQLASAPSWMKHSIRHDSPELSQTWPSARTPGMQKPTPEHTRHQKSSRSKSAFPPRKRARPTLIELEAGQDHSPRAKSQRTALHLDPTSATQGNKRVSSAVRTPRKALSSHKHRDNIPAYRSEPRNGSKLRHEVPHIVDDFHELLDERINRRRASSLGSVRRSIEI